MSASNISLFSIPHCETAKEHAFDFAAKISKVLKETNESFFFASQSFKVELLKNRPQDIDVLATWSYDEWHSYDKDLSKEKLVQSLEKSRNHDKIPLLFVIVHKDKPIGMIELKRRDDEFDEFSKETLWMGSLHVALESRNQGLGGELYKLVVRTASQLGFKEFFFYTSKVSNVEWYKKKGATVYQEGRPFRGHTVTIFKMVV